MRRFDFTFPDSMQRLARHLVELYPNDNWTTIVAIDRSEPNACSSVTNSIECLVNELVDKEGLNPERIIVIEHYDDLGTYDLVKFNHRAKGRFSDPVWKAITAEEAKQWMGVSHAAQAGQQPGDGERKHQQVDA